MLLEIVGLILGLIGAFGLAAVNLLLNPIQVINGQPSVSAKLAPWHKKASITGMVLIAIGFSLQITQCY